MKKICLIIGIVLLSVSTVWAKKMDIRKSGAYLSDYTLAELTAEFQNLRYTAFLLPAGNVYPRIFVENLPKDFETPENKTIRNQMFMQIVVPYVLKINEELSEHRKNLLAVRDDFKQNLDFEPFEMYYLEYLAKQYDVVTPFRDTRRYIFFLRELISRVDVVPPSIVVAVASMNTRWGTSRLALEGNNLFKARNWYSDEGLKPIGPDANEPYRYVIYPNLEESIRAYMHKLNTDINRQSFRNARRIARKRSKFVFGKQIVSSLVLDNNLTNYVGLLDYTITFYKMSQFDRATLENEYDFAN